MIKNNKIHPLFWLLSLFVIALVFGDNVKINDYLPKQKTHYKFKKTSQDNDIINYSKFVLATLKHDDRGITKYGGQVKSPEKMENVIRELIGNMDFDLALQKAKAHPNLKISKVIMGFNAFKLNQYKDTIKYLKDDDSNLSKIAVIISKKRLGLKYNVPKDLESFKDKFKIKNSRGLIAEFMAYTKNDFFLKMAFFMDKNNFNTMTDIATDLLKKQQYEKLAKFTKNFPNTDQAKIVAINIIDSIPKKQGLHSKTILDGFDKNDKFYNFALAVYELRQKQYEKSLTAIKKVDGFDDNYMFNFFYGIILDKNKMRIQSIEKLKIANKQSNNEPNISNYLSYTMIEENLDLENNLIKLLKAYSKLPEYYIADSVGWAYYKLGEYDKALEYMNTAIKGLASDGVVNDHLGDVYLKLGRTNEAIIQWKRAIELDPDNTYMDVQAIKDKIKKYSNETNVRQ